MRKQKRILAAALTVVFLCSFLTATALAVTDAEVEAQVAAQGKEAVTSNIFIWFLCAISFLKISQKIDSFMASLGVNVGRTGGSMLSEILVATRGISIGKNMFGGGNGGAPSSGGASGSSGSGSGGGRNGGSPGFLSGKLIVAIMAKGHFTKKGHFIVLRGVTSDGMILVADPGSHKRSEQEWDLSIILDEARKDAGANGPFWIIG